MDRDWLLVTGPTHGGTRLIVSVLSQHPEIAVPAMDELSVAKDSPWLHNIFIQAVRRMGLHEDQAPLDPEELRFVLEAYEEACGPGRYCLVKLPNYPMMAREAVEEAIDLDVVVYTSRSSDRILASKKKRGKDVRHAEERSQYLYQVKKCLPEDRKRVLNARDYETLHEAQMKAFRARIEAWKQAEGPPEVLRLYGDDVVENPQRLEELLDVLDLSRDPLEMMRAVVDANRLQQRGRWYQLKEQGLRAKNWLAARLGDPF